MPRIERGQFAEFLRRYLSMTGESHVADELAPEMAPCLVLEAERPEWEFIKNAKLMHMVTAVGGAVGTASAIRIRNPVNSGVVAIVEQWHFSPNAVSAINLQRDQTNTDLASSVQPIPRDTRWGGVGAVSRSAMIGSQTNAGGAFGDIVWSITVPANVPWYYPGPFVLHPGWALTLAGVTTNLTINGGVQWLEKRIDNLELSSPGA